MNKQPITRREFFKKGFQTLGEGIKETATALYADDVQPDIKPELIRPPGALPEAEFLEKCTRCNECVKVCPEESIMKFIGEGTANHLTPMLHLRKSSCILCEDFPCVRVCEPGALIMPENRTAVKMGIAVINQKLCHAWQGMDCDYCVRACPLDIKAIAVHEFGRPEVVSQACTGCGLCEQICPSRQPAIVVKR